MTKEKNTAKSSLSGSKLFIYATLIGLSIFTIFPFFWAILTSFKTEQQALVSPPIWWLDEWHIENYNQALTIFPFGRFYLNTIIFSVVSTVGRLFTSLLAGYVLAKFNFRAKKLIFILIISTMMIPYWINIVPIYFMLSKIKWIDTYLGLIVPQLAHPLGIFLIRQYLTSIPNDYIDSGRIDGAGEWSILWRIIFPQCLPVMATLSIYFFVASWNSFMWPLIVTRSEEMRTITVGLALLSGSPQRTQYPLQMAAATIGMIPPIIIFLFLQKYLTKGFILSGLKG